MKIILSAIIITIIVVVVSQFGAITNIDMFGGVSHHAIHCDGDSCFEIGSDGTLGKSVAMPPAPKRDGQ